MNQEDKKLGFAGKIAKVFVHNSKLSLLLLLTMFAWGILSFFITPKQYNPEIVAPAFQVITEFPGASSKEVEELITKPLEDKLADIDGVEDIMSQSIDGGVSILVVNFYVGEDVEASKVKIIQKVYGNIDLKPVGVGEPIIKDIDPDNVPVLTVAFNSDSLSEIELRKLVVGLKDEVKKIKNVANIDVLGGKKREVKIVLNPLELTAKGISVFEVVEVLRKNNLKLPSGNLEVDSKNIAVEVDGIIFNVEQLKKIPLRVMDEHIVYLEDVAVVVDGAEEVTEFVKFKTKGDFVNKNTVYLSLAKKKGANVSQVTKGVKKRLKSIKKESTILENVDLEFVRDEGVVADEEIFGLVVNLLQAILIVSLVLFAFLGARSAFVVAIAIPLVLASVFGAGFLAGQTINRITLFALILSLGLLVDNATVIVENIARHLKRGDIDKRYPVIRAVDEVGLGLLMSTITTLLAFFPMMFITGMMGPYMGPIAFFVPAALVFSLIIAFSINPFLSYRLLSKDEVDPVLKDDLIIKPSEIKCGEWKNPESLLAKICVKTKTWGGEKWDDLALSYKNLLLKIFNNKKFRKKILIFVALLFIVSIALPAIGVVKFRMLPKADREQFYVYLDYPEGTLIEENNRITSKVEDFLLREKEVVSIQSFVGVAPVVDFNGLFKGSDARKNSNNATIKVNLTHHDRRSIKSEKLVQDLRPELYKFLENEPGTKIVLVEDPPGPPVLSTMLIKVKGDNYERLKEVAKDIERMFYQTSEVVDIDTSIAENQKKLILKIDYEKALRSGVSSEMASQALRIALNGANVSVLHNDKTSEQEFVVMRYAKEYRNRIDDLKLIYISSMSSEKIPLSEIVKVETRNIEDVLYRDNREKTVYITAEMGARSVTYAVIDMYLKLFKYNLDNKQGDLKNVSFYSVDYIDKDTGEIIKIDWGGEWKLTVEVFRDLGAAMMVAIFLIYVVLVAQFKSFKTPALVMVTIPLALIGVLPGFAILAKINGIYFNATSMIGVIALAGIVVNNAIILLEYLNNFRGKGINIKDALIDAGTTRMRPIILTSLTTILGSLTIVGDPVWAGLAWAIIFGISISTVLTLVMFPVFYFMFEGDEWN